MPGSGGLAHAPPFCQIWPAMRSPRHNPCRLLMGARRSDADVCTRVYLGVAAKQSSLLRSDLRSTGSFKCHMLRPPPRCSLQMTFSLPENAASPIYPSRSQSLETICDMSSVSIGQYPSPVTVPRILIRTGCDRAAVCHGVHVELGWDGLEQHSAVGKPCRHEALFQPSHTLCRPHSWA